MDRNGRKMEEKDGYSLLLLAYVREEEILVEVREEGGGLLLLNSVPYKTLPFQLNWWVPRLVRF